jgi:hypothetical protein
MKLTVIQEDSIHGYPLGTVLIVKPILNEDLNRVYFDLHENETKYQEFLNGTLNQFFDIVRSGYEDIGNTLKTRIIGEIPISPNAILPHLMEIFYSELLALPKYSSTYWDFDTNIS